MVCLCIRLKSHCKAPNWLYMQHVKKVNWCVSHFFAGSFSALHPWSSVILRVYMSFSWCIVLIPFSTLILLHVTSWPCLSRTLHLCCNLKLIYFVNESCALLVKSIIVTTNGMYNTRDELRIIFWIQILGKLVIRELLSYLWPLMKQVRMKNTNGSLLGFITQNQGI